MQGRFGRLELVHTSHHACGRRLYVEDVARVERQVFRGHTARLLLVLTARATSLLLRKVCRVAALWWPHVAREH